MLVRALLLLALASLLLAGCAAPAADVSSAPALDAPAAESSIDCVFCYEPMVTAWEDGLVVDDWGRGFHWLDADGTLRQTEAPKPDLGPSTQIGEPVLGRAKGAFVYAHLVHNGVGLHDEAVEGEPANMVYVHRLADGGEEWIEVARFAPGRASGHAYAIGDRVWIAVQGERVVVSWYLATPGGVEMALSEDSGRTWSDARVVLPSKPMGVASPRIALAADGRLLVASVLSSTTFIGTADMPGVVRAHVSDDGGMTWTTLDAPGATVLGPSTRGFWTGASWSDALGFVLAWSTQGGAIALTSSIDGDSWTEPQEVARPEGPWAHPWVEPAGRCVTMSLWTSEGFAGPSTLRFLVVLDGELVLEETVARQAMPRTDYPHHAVSGASAAVVWVGDEGLHLRPFALDGLGCSG